MPIDLVLVRHGQSEGNLAQAKSKKGDDSFWTGEFSQRPSSMYRLTKKGVEQAKSAGEWIKENISPRFDRYYCSEYLRAMETAAYLEFENAEWFSEFYLREQDMGVLAGKSSQQRKEEYAHELARRDRDAFYYAPPGGESIAECALRVEKWISQLRQNAAGMKVIAVCHGNIMKAIRLRIEKMTSAEWHKFDNDPYYQTYNSQVLHYSRRDPVTGRIGHDINWFRTYCPWNPSKTPTDWVRVYRPSWTNEQLLSWAELTPRLVDNVDEEEVDSTS
jgi:broad specificity phosphatase PhoE